MNVYGQNSTYYITADKGEVEVKTAAGRTTPHDVTFGSNVVIHLVADGGGSVQESFLYLDNLVFLSDESRLTATGPVRLVSKDGQMGGTDLDLIYNDQTGQLEHFKIANFEGQLAAAVSTGTPPAETPAQT